MIKSTNNILLESTRQQINSIKYGKLIAVLADHLGFTLSAARYLVRFAEAVYAEGNDRTKYKNFEEFLDKYFKGALKYSRGALGEVKSLLKDVDTQIRHPVAFVDLVMSVFHSTIFMHDYKIDTVDNRIVLTPTKSKPTGGSFEAIDPDNPRDEFEERLVKYLPKALDFFYIQDDNWITFKPRNYGDAHYLKSFYLSLYANEYPEIKEITSLLNTSWCIANQASMFSSQKADPARDSWYITFSKRHIIDLLIDATDGALNEDDMLDEDGNIIAGTLTLGRAYEYTKRSQFLGEAFLSSARSHERHGNVGVHNFANSPGSAIPASVLEPAKTYEYPNYKGTLGMFTIEGGILTAVAVPTSQKHVQIPLGVTEIAARAFSGNNDITSVILPPSLKIIRSNAFSEAPAIKKILLNDTLEVIETDAFKLNWGGQTRSRDLSSCIIGVPNTPITSPDVLANIQSQDEVRRPRNLKYIPRVYDSFLFDTDPSNPPTLTDEKYEIKRPVFINGQGILVEDGCLKAIDTKRMPAEFRDTCILPEGIVSISPQLDLSSSPRKLVFPKSLISLPNGTFAKRELPVKLEEIDLSSSNIPVIPDRAFYENNFLRRIDLPARVRTIGRHAFFQAQLLSTIKIPSSASDIHKAAFSNTASLSAIITDNREALLSTLRPMYTTVDDKGNTTMANLYQTLEFIIKEEDN